MGEGMKRAFAAARRTRGVATTFRYWLMQDGLAVARAESADDNKARAEIGHYAVVYGQDGPVEVIADRRNPRLTGAN